MLLDALLIKMQMEGSLLKLKWNSHSYCMLQNALAEGN